MASPPSAPFPRTAAFLVLAATALAHAGLFAHPEFIYDDQAQIVQNKDIRSLRAIPDLFLRSYWGDRHSNGLYRPLVHTTFAVETATYGLRPALFRLDNLLLHLVATLLVFILSRRLLGGAIPPALAALFFGLHPAHAEAVAGIVGRADLLAAVAVLGAVLLFQDFLREGGARRAAGILALFALGLFSKESALLLPVFLLLAAPTVPERAPGRRRRLAFLAAALVAVAAGPLGLRYAALHGESGGLAPSGEAAPLGDRPLADRAALAGRLVADYAAMGLFPLRLSPDYPLYGDAVPTFRGNSEAPRREGIEPPAATARDLALPAAAAILLALAIFSFARGSPLGFGALFFLAALLPVLNLVPIGCLKACRFLYLPSAGLSIVFGFLVARAPAGAARPAAALIVAFLALLNAGEIAAWRTNLALWTRAARAEPGSFIGQLKLAGEVLSSPKAREENPPFFPARARRAAADSLRRAQRIAPAEPRPYLRLGRIALETGRPEEALDFALRAQPFAAGTLSDREAFVLLGFALHALNRHEEAFRAFREAIQPQVKGPPQFEPYLYLGVGAARQGNFALARNLLAEALRLEPNHAGVRINLARVYRDLGQPDLGRALVEEILPRLGEGHPDRNEALRLLDELRAAKPKP